MFFKIKYKKNSILFILFLLVLPSQIYSMSFQQKIKDTVKPILVADTTLKTATTNQAAESKQTGSKKNWNTTPPLPIDSANNIALKLLAESEVYKDAWSGASVFVYDKYSYSNLPDTIQIPLIKTGQKFQLTWYGNLNFKYGMRWGRMHKGLDLYLQTGDSVVSAFDGIVRYAKFNSGGFGNCVVVRHTNGLETVYGHLSKIIVTENQYVQGGETVGLGGTTGNSTGPHLHFETRYKDFTIDPEMYYDFKTGTLLSDTLVLNKSKLSAERYPTAKVKSKRSRRSRYTSKGRSTKKVSKQPAKKSTKTPVKKKAATTTKKSTKKK